MGKAARSKLKSRHGETPSRQKKPAAINKDVSATKVNDLDNKQLELAKKEIKKKQRHEAWLEKLDHSYAVKKQQKKKEIKIQNNLGMDLSGIGDILDTIKFKSKPAVTAMATEEEKKESIIPTNKIKSKKAKKQAEMQEIVRMQKLMQFGEFKQNPLSTIRQHVQNTFCQ
ncbi:hypothetical protein G6F37_011619 [Rhizopus arrhizus]|nr:hypothetical protein G6F38_010076 [Rhizopus arrhizus]KAG1148357.1 hypothetical protein G6F37_011619 [Rhizopus arrhizus]